MEHIDTLIAPRWVIPIEPGGRVLDHHALAVDRGRIVAIVPAAAAAQRFAPRERIERPQHVLLPGFVNAHTRAAAALLRGAAESGSYHHWLNRQIQPLEQRWTDAEYVRDGTELAVADMLTSGTTCFADLDLFPEVVAQTASALRIRACVGLPVLDAPTLWAGSASECLDKGLRLHDEYRDDPLITTALAPYAPAAVSDETLIRVRRAADELELPVTIRLVPRHLETGQLELSAAAEPILSRLDRVGLLSPLLTALHALELDEAQIGQLARAGASVAHCPQANLKLGLGLCPAARLKARGVNVGLGTDSAACNNDLCMLDELRTAALLARGLFPDVPAISAHEWLKTATLSGAQALGLGEVIGSLTAGKWADLCCIDLSRPHTQPVYDPAAQILFAVTRAQVSDVWVAGRPLLREGRLTHSDVEDVLHRARQWRERILGSLPTS